MAVPGALAHAAPDVRAGPVVALAAAASAVRCGTAGPALFGAEGAGGLGASFGCCACAGFPAAPGGFSWPGLLCAGPEVGAGSCFGVLLATV